MPDSQYIYGRHPVCELLGARPKDIERLLVAQGGEPRTQDVTRLAAAAGVTVDAVSRQQLQRLVGQVPHQGIVAVVAPFVYTPLESLTGASACGAPPLLVALDQVQDPHNLGSLIRSAFALGAHGLLFPKDRACEVTPTVVKAAAGATAHLPIARVTNLRRSLEQLKQAGLWVVGTSPDAPQPLQTVDLCQPVVLVVGSEGDGMRHGTRAACDYLAHIPMAGDLGSLNAGVAGAIGLYEAARQRRAGPASSAPPR